MEITGAQLVVKALKAENTDTLFAYPGGQAIDLFNELYDEKEIRIIMPRHEQGLVHAADGYARASGKTGVCLVTSGPGTTNLVTGIATANIDSVPLVCFTGQVSSGLIGRESFQEVNTVQIMKSICKYAVTVRDRRELGEAVRSAFQAARSGRPARRSSICRRIFSRNWVLIFIRCAQTIKLKCLCRRKSQTVVWKR